MSSFSVTDVTARPRIPSRQRGTAYWRELDWVLLVAAFATTIFGSVLVWSASRSDMASPTDPQSYLKRHLVNILMGVALGFIASRLDYRWLRA